MCVCYSFISILLWSTFSSFNFVRKRTYIYMYNTCKNVSRSIIKDWWKRKSEKIKGQMLHSKIYLHIVHICIHIYTCVSIIYIHVYLFIYIYVYTHICINDEWWARHIYLVDSVFNSKLYLLLFVEMLLIMQFSEKEREQKSTTTDREKKCPKKNIFEYKMVLFLSV